jgi:hypothetical protein
MNKAEKIANQIKNLTDELLALTLADGISSPNGKNPFNLKANYKGAAGALAMLTNEGFFDSPRNIAAVMDKLKEIGRHYPQPTVSMNLLNLTKRRTFSRIADKDTKKWLYVLRK